jgi:hypothetical protein
MSNGTELLGSIERAQGRLFDPEPDRPDLGPAVDALEPQDPPAGQEVLGLLDAPMAARTHRRRLPGKADQLLSVHPFMMPDGARFCLPNAHSDARRLRRRMRRSGNVR